MNDNGRSHHHWKRQDPTRGYEAVHTPVSFFGSGERERGKEGQWSEKKAARSDIVRSSLLVGDSQEIQSPVLFELAYSFGLGLRALTLVHMRYSLMLCACLPARFNDAQKGAKPIGCCVGERRW